MIDLSVDKKQVRCKRCYQWHDLYYCRDKAGRHALAYSCFTRMKKMPLLVFIPYIENLPIPEKLTPRQEKLHREQELLKHQSTLF